MEAQIARIWEDLAELKRALFAAGAAPGPSALVFRDPLRDGGEGPEMVSLPGGSFLMGSPTDEPERSDDEGPQHRVDIPPFAIGRTEVTFADFDRFASATGRKLTAARGSKRASESAPGMCCGAVPECVHLPSGIAELHSARVRKEPRCGLGAICRMATASRRSRKTGR